MFEIDIFEGTLERNNFKMKHYIFVHRAQTVSNAFLEIIRTSVGVRTSKMFVSCIKHFLLINKKFKESNLILSKVNFSLILSGFKMV